MRVFIIHGWTYNLEKWEAFVALLRAQRVVVKQLKVPGLTTKSDKVWDIDGYINWLDEELKGEEHPIIIGHSNGGRIALAYSIKYPQRLKKLILIDSAGVPRDQLKAKIKLKVLWFLSKVGKVLSIVPGAKKIFYRVIGAHDYQNAPPNMKLTMRNMLAVDENLNLHEVQTPTTIIWGKNDKVTPLRDGQRMAKQIPQSTLHIIDNAQHAPFASQPQAVLELILKELTP
jgi:pimeloyl-ACP methyl ester carboxylesterase